MELGNGVTINFLELAQADPALFLAGAAEMAEAAQAQGLELPQFAGANAVSGATADEAEPTTEEPAAVEEEPKAETSIFDELTAEQQERATDVMVALAEKFDRDMTDFSVLRHVGEQGEETFFVGYTATQKIDLGDPRKLYDKKRSWNSGVAKEVDPRFIVEVDGQEIDTRDSQEIGLLRTIAAANPEINEWVWRFGEREKAGRGAAPVAALLGGRARASWPPVRAPPRPSGSVPQW